MSRGKEQELTGLRCHAVIYDLNAFLMGLRLPLDPWGRGPSYPLHSPVVMPGPDHCVDTLYLVWAKILG